MDAPPDPAVTIEGWLIKRSGSRRRRSGATWSKRYFQLTQNGMLMWFKVDSPLPPRPRGSLQLSPQVEALVDADPSKPWTFSLRLRGSRDLLLQAKGPQEREQWVNGLRRHTTRERVTEPRAAAPMVALDAASHPAQEVATSHASAAAAEDHSSTAKANGVVVDIAVESGVGSGAGSCAGSGVGSEAGSGMGSEAGSSAGSEAETSGGEEDGVEVAGATAVQHGTDDADGGSLPALWQSRVPHQPTPVEEERLPLRSVGLTTLGVNEHQGEGGRGQEALGVGAETEALSEATRREEERLERELGERARLLHQEGLRANKQGDTRRAEACFVQAHQLAPTVPTHLLSAANMALKRGSGGSGGVIHSAQECEACAAAARAKLLLDRALRMDGIREDHARMARSRLEQV